MNNMEVNLQIHSQLEKLIEWNLEVIVSLNKLFNSTFQGDSHINLETINNGEIKPDFNGIFRYQYFCLTSYFEFQRIQPSHRRIETGRDWHDEYDTFGHVFKVSDFKTNLITPYYLHINLFELE